MLLLTILQLMALKTIELRISGGWGSLVHLKLLDALGEGMDHFYVHMVGS